MLLVVIVLVATASGVLAALAEVLLPRLVLFVALGLWPIKEGDLLCIGDCRNVPVAAYCLMWSRSLFDIR